MNAEKKQLQAYCGNLYQVCGTRPYCLTDGRTNGCRCIDVRSGSGLDFTVVPDRAMDISLASYCGTNLAYLTAGAETHPAFYESFGNEWLRTFSAGLLTTLGPTYLGPACEDEGETLGLHGRMSTIPAERTADLSDPAEGRIELRGTMREAYPFGPKLQIDRVIRASAKAPVLEIEDTVTNYGGSAAPLCLLYHINFGFPLLSEDAQLLVPQENWTPADESSSACSRELVRRPDGGLPERNYAYSFAPTSSCRSVGIWNPALNGGLGVFIRFDPHQLPFMNQWILENPADYVAALEPATCPCESRSTLRKQGLLPMLEAGERRSFRVQIGVLRSEEEKAAMTDGSAFYDFSEDRRGEHTAENKY